MQLKTVKGIRLWWRARQWLSYDVRDERATMEMLLSFALFIVVVMFLGSFVWYLYLGELTLIACMAMYDGCALLVFVFLALNSCIEVNELMMNDSLMLTNMRYYLLVEQDPDTSTKEQEKQSRKDQQEVDHMLGILVAKIERLDEPQKVFGIVIDSALRAKFVSAIVITLGSTVFKFLWKLVHGDSMPDLQSFFNQTNGTTGIRQIFDLAE